MNLYSRLESLEQDLGMTLTTTETIRDIEFEEPTAFDGERVRYSTTTGEEGIVTAFGFAWEQDGVTIRGRFPKPIEAIRVVETYGNQEVEVDEKAIARAILAALGPIPCRDEVVLGMAA